MKLPQVFTDSLSSQVTINLEIMETIPSINFMSYIETVNKLSQNGSIQPARGLVMLKKKIFSHIQDFSKSLLLCPANIIWFGNFPQQTAYATNFLSYLLKSTQ